MSVTVAHSFPVWLPQTQTWLYHQVRFLPDTTTSHIICKETQNLDQFDLPNIHSLSGPSSPFSLRTTQWFRHLDYHCYTLWKCRTIQPDILHSHFGPVAWKNHRLMQLFSSKRLNNIRQVVTFYGQDVDRLPKIKPVWKQRYRDMFRCIDLVLCEGPFMAGIVEELGCPPDRIQVHHLGVDLRTITYRPRVKQEHEPYRVLMAAAFRPKKGFLYALMALEQLSKKYDLVVTLVGDAVDDDESKREKKNIMQFIRSSQLKKVCLTGFLSQKQLLETARDHHIYLAPSVTAPDGDSEGGLPVSLIEMAASGMPVVSSNHCDIPELIRHGENGLLADERDVSGIVDNLERLLSRPEIWPAMTRKARIRIETYYSADKQGKRLSNIYDMISDKSKYGNKLEYINKESDQPLLFARPRILFVSHSGEMYGAERSLLELLIELKQYDCYNMRILLPFKGAFSQALDAAGMDYQIIPYSRWIGSRYRYITRYIRRLHNRYKMRHLIREIESWDPDIIYSNTIATPVGAWLSERLPRRPRHIWHARELPGFPEYGFGYFDYGLRRTFELIVRTSDRFICNSHYLAGKLKPLLEHAAKTVETDGLSEFRTDVIYNGFKTSDTNTERTKRRKTKGKAFRIVMVGSICPRKNYGEAIQGLRMLVEEEFPVHLEIYGSGSDADVKQLENEIRKAGMEEYTTLRGYCADMGSMYSDADILLITSRMETFGRVAVEAMFAGCPVVSSDAGALSEIIHNEETGLLYRSGNSNDMVRQIKSLLSNEDLRKRLVRYAAERARLSYGMDAYASAVHQVIRETLPLNKRPADIEFKHEAGAYFP